MDNGLRSAGSAPSVSAHRAHCKSDERTGTPVTGPVLRWFVAVVLSLASAHVTPSAQQRQAAPNSPAGAQAPAFSCDRNHLTVYTGVVTRYRRAAGQTSLRIRTDDDTTENVVLKHPGTDDPSAMFQMNAAPFTTRDWPTIELKKSTLRPGTRASAWVCDDGQVMVDWSAPRERR